MFYESKNFEKGVRKKEEEQGGVFEYKGEKYFVVEGRTFTLKNLLADYEKEAMKSGLKLLGDWLQSRTKVKLPRIVLFPETSARLLLYAINPILKTIYSQKCVKEPNKSFIVTYGELTLGEDLLKKHTFPKLKKIEQERKELAQKLKVMRNALRQRVKEIITKNNIKNGDTVLVVDDYATESTATIRALEKTVKEQLPRSTFQAFVFGASYKLKDNPSKKVLVGKNYSLSIRQVQSAREATTGVTKKTEEGEKLLNYVQLSKTRNPALMREFRNELRMIGEEVAQEFKTKP